MSTVTTKNKNKKSPEFPKVIKIGALKWKVAFKDEPGGYKDAWGVTIYTDGALEFVPKWPSMGKMVEVVLHEINHAVLNSFSTKSNKPQEEQFVTTSAAGLAAVLIDNPKLTKWLNWAIDEARKETKA